MVQSFAATIINAKHVSIAFCRQQQWLTNRQYTFPHGGWSHEHIDQDKQKENLLRRLLLFLEEGKQDNQLQSQCCKQDSSSDKKASLYEKLQERRSRRFLSHTKRQVAIWRIQPSKHSHIKVYRQTMKGVCRFIQKGFYWRKEKRCLASITFTKHPFRQS